jgi:hypothetical protein
MGGAVEAAEHELVHGPLGAFYTWRGAYRVAKDAGVPMKVVWMMCGRNRLGLKKRPLPDGFTIHVDDEIARSVVDAVGVDWDDWSALAA